MSFVTSVLSVIPRLLLNKFRHCTVNYLKEGDLTDEKCRKMIERGLDSIKTKLDGLALKDLNSSVSFLVEGLGTLNLVRVEISEGEKDDISVAEGSTKEQLVAAVPTVINEACSLTLSNEIGKLNIASRKRIESAMRSFEKSNTKATEAFGNKALSTEDRILATKLRVMSRILASLDDPDAAVVACKGYLKELHDLPAVQGIVSVQLSGGMKSVFNKTERLENVMSVTMINFVVFDFAKKFSKIPVSVLNWPTIDLGERTYNPMLTEGEMILKQVEESGARPPIQFTSMEEKEKASWISFPQVNSKREIIGVLHGHLSGYVSKLNAGKAQIFCKFPQEDVKANDFLKRALAIDEEDNVYIVTVTEKAKDVLNHELFVFDANGNMKHQSPLEFLDGIRYYDRQIAVTKDMLVIRGADRVYVCDSSGQLKYSFPLEESFMEVYLSIPNKNEIIVASRWSNVVSIYTEEGKLKKRCEVPGEDHRVVGIAFNHVNKEIIVIAEKDKRFYLSSFSETGELRQNYPLPSTTEETDWYIKITSHPSGPVAIIYFGRVLTYMYMQ